MEQGNIGEEVNVVGPVISVDPSSFPGAAVGDQVKVKSVGTVTQVGKRLVIQMTDVSVESGEEESMSAGFAAGSKSDEERV